MRLESNSKCRNLPFCVAGFLTLLIRPDPGYRLRSSVRHCDFVPTVGMSIRVGRVSFVDVLGLPLRSSWVQLNVEALPNHDPQVRPQNDSNE